MLYLTTHTSKILKSPVARARAFGNPYDPARIELLETLFLVLNQQEFKKYPDVHLEKASFKNFSFFEAYFSNYIEGTIFELEEAKDIIETQKPLPSRNDDSHDILGTYKLVGNVVEMSIVPSSAEEFLKIPQYRHQVLLMARVDKKPGEFKDKNNRPGNTHFVDYTLVRGTLIKGFEFYNVLKDPFAKAAYMMFLISEVHPFLDGNARVARVMMNAELVKAGQTRIMIPTVYRDDYLGALRRLTRKADPEVYIRMLQRAQNFCAVLSAESIDDMESQLEKSNAFKEHDEARLRF